MKKNGFTLISLLALVVVFFLFAVQSLVFAQGGADYGRGPETDPVASGLSAAVSARVVRVEAQTNTWNGAATLATSVSGRVAVVEGQTNTWNQGAVNAANWTNHAALMVATATNIIITADAKTNTIIIERGSIKSWDITQ